MPSLSKQHTGTESNHVDSSNNNDEEDGKQIQSKSFEKQPSVSSVSASYDDYALLKSLTAASRFKR